MTKTQTLEAETEQTQRSVPVITERFEELDSSETRKIIEERSCEVNVDKWIFEQKIQILCGSSKLDLMEYEYGVVKEYGLFPTDWTEWKKADFLKWAILKTVTLRDLKANEDSYEVKE